MRKGTRTRSASALFALAAAAILAATNVNAAGTNTKHEIQVYSIKTYADLSDYCTSTTPDWKPAIGLDDEQDPYIDFWSEMYTNCGTGSACAHEDSMRRQNSAVTANSMINDGVNDWEDADMVFFYGHNAMIKPQWSESFQRWYPYYGYGGLLLGWCRTTSDWINWGTSSDPYYYHRYWRTDASLTNSFAIFYGYNPLTSVLVGKDYSSTGTWYTENTWNQSTADAHSGKLDDDTEWIIAHGCQAVTTAKPQSGDPTDIRSCPLGVNAWKKTWDNLHIVLGHYYITTTACEPYLGGNGSNDFASMIKSGDEIKEAYFDIHTCNSSSNPAWYQPSAIALSSTSCCTLTQIGDYWILVCPPEGCSNSFMNAETWTSPMSNLTGDTYYATSWREAE